MPKVSKESALYFPPQLIGDPRGAACGHCSMFNPKGTCSVVAGNINGEHGVCGLFVLGQPGDHPVMAALPKSATGYTEEGPTKCGNCKYFSREGGVGGHGLCKLVEGVVHEHGCCDLWERSEENEEMMNTPFEQMGM